MAAIALPASGCVDLAVRSRPPESSYDLDKIVSRKFADKCGRAYQLVKSFHWTNDDQNLVSRYIAVDKMLTPDAAKKWVDANKDKVTAWLPKGMNAGHRTHRR